MQKDINNKESGSAKITFFNPCQFKVMIKLKRISYNIDDLHLRTLLQLWVTFARFDLQFFRITLRLWSIQNLSNLLTSWMTSSCLFWYRVELSFLRASVNVIFFNSSHTTRKNSVSVSHTSWKDKLVKIRICNFFSLKKLCKQLSLKMARYIAHFIATWE